ncbi:SRPBCC family protein [Nocardioides jiangxiensis]|uniref:SRPBCC family protein n=1 Tax=Nocardioides jiangxiensis TaxID=3064524 RepID=A0ABT9B0G0_9ACTN|nr:SRPBCC family protein [Nocardioides sp. WY-20]MDO7867107.1 SRPBCC family protein [Nocardioides sp. WY-20]
MTTVVHHETTIDAPEGLPIIEIVREFDAPPSAVFRAHADPELFARWNGPRSVEARIDDWSCETGGRWRYAAVRGGEEVAEFFGSFHEVRPGERIVQTFTYAGFPDAVSLEILTLEPLDGGRCRLRAVSVGDSVEARDRMIAAGMSSGVIEGYEQLDEFLAAAE